MKLTAFSLDPIDLRLARSYSTAAGDVGDRSGVRLRLEAADGELVGEGEAAPIPGRPSTGLDSLATAVTAWARGGMGVPIEELVADLDRTSLDAPARFAVHTALVDLQARAASMPLHQFLRVGARPQVAVSALVADPAPAEVAERCRQIAEDGFGAVKLKVAAADPAVDVTRIVAASEMLGPGIGLRLDANRAWTVEQFGHVIGRVGPRRIEYVEDPTDDPAEYGRLGELAGVRTALDADIADPERLEQVATESAIDVVVVKAAAIGGVDRVLDLARRLAPERRVVLSSSIDGSIGLRAGLHAAAAMPDEDVHGLGTASMVQGVDESLQPVAGAVNLSAAPGLGPS